jgi:hypothetical protein
MFETIRWALILGVAVGACRAAAAEPIQPPPLPSRVPVVVEEAPVPRPKATVEVAPPARPVQSADPVRPAPLTQPGFNLRPPEPRLNFNPGGPPAPPTTELLPPPSFVAPGGPAVPTPAPGDTPMPALPTRQLVLSAVFGAALAAAPASQVAAQDEKKNQPDLAAIKTQLDQIEKDVKSLQKFRKDTDDLVLGKENSTALADMGLIRRLSEIESQINRINETLRQINLKLGDPSRSTTSAFGPTLPGAAVGRGYVRIVNDYPTEMSMIVNGRSYRVPPGQATTVDVPPGSFTYELLHAGSAQKATTVREGETMTLRIR